MVDMASTPSTNDPADESDEELLAKLRPPKVGREHAAATIAELATRMSLNEIARRSGITRRTVQDWARIARDSE